MAGECEHDGRDMYLNAVTRVAMVSRDLKGRIEYWRQECGELTYLEAIGILEMIKLDLYAELKGED